MLGAERDRSSCHGLVHGARSRLELAADRGADEVRAVRVEALVDEQVDLAEIYQANVDRDLLALVDLGHAPPLYITVPSGYHLLTIYVDGVKQCRKSVHGQSKGSWRVARLPKPPFT